MQITLSQRTTVYQTCLLVLLLFMMSPAARGDNPQSAGLDTDTSLPTFKSLRTPTSPAFTLLGIEPTSVERPSNPSDLALSFVDRTNLLSEVPKDFAIEFSPYWLISPAKNHSPRNCGVDWRDEVEWGKFRSFLRTATISAGTAEVGTEEAPLTALSVGTRFSLYAGTVSVKKVKEIRTELAELRDLFDQVARDRISALDRKEKNALEAAGNDPATRESIEREYEAQRTLVRWEVLQDPRLLAEIAKKEEEFQAWSTSRDGFWLELAGGWVWNFPNAAWGEGKLQRWGGWLTPSYQCRNRGWSVVGVGRYLGERESDDILEFGARAIYARSKYGISAEAVYRYILDGGEVSDAQYRLAIMMEYELSKDMWVHGSFGPDTRKSKPEDGDLEESVAGTLVAQLGLTWNFGTERLIPLSQLVGGPADPTSATP